MGIGLDSAELGNPPSLFQGVFERAEKLGLKRVAHAGAPHSLPSPQQADSICKYTTIPGMTELALHACALCLLR